MAVDADKLNFVLCDVVFFFFFSLNQPWDEIPNHLGSKCRGSKDSLLKVDLGILLICLMTGGGTLDASNHTLLFTVPSINCLTCTLNSSVAQ